MRWIAVSLALLALAGCQHNSAVFPDARELRAVTEAKPKPSPAVLTDPAASDRHNAAIESWGERIYAAGVRLCRFYDRQGMALDCDR